MIRSFPSRSAFSLGEVTLALAIAAFCLVSLFGLVPVGVQINRNAMIADSCSRSSYSGTVREQPQKLRSPDRGVLVFLQRRPEIVQFGCDCSVCLGYLFFERFVPAKVNQAGNDQNLN